MHRCGKALWLSLVWALSIANTSFLTAQATSSGSHVRPCTSNENEVGSSAEVTRLFGDEHPTFSWCEALDVPWLPNAEILRFHTAIQIDYSSVCTIVKATSESHTRLIWAAGEGMVALPPPGLPDSLDAMNDLLRSAQPALNDSQLGSASILYLFLIHREIRQSFFSKPASRYTLGETDYRVRLQKHGKSRLVLLTTRTSDWEFTFSSHKDGMHLDSVMPKGSN